MYSHPNLIKQQTEIFKENDMEEMELIYAYTRAQAFEDGFLVDVSETAKEAGFHIPVALTHAVYESCVEWTEEDGKKAYQDKAGRLWDVIYMAADGIRRQRCANKDMILYQLYVVPRGKSKAKKTVLKLTIGGGDNAEPVITIMLPDED